ncbi:MAG: hypothetical protein E6Q34_02910 [Burkholderiaceae bacterium]|nr:MAG: hypothetical protein E6Q34_02910 [Burkholderiaceae bacterium]
MIKRIRVLTLLTAILCATNSWAGAKPIFIKYECSAGEKPGSPRYQLLVLGETYRVEKTSVALPRAQMQRIAYGTLSQGELKELAHIAPTLAATKIELPDAASLAGICSWNVEVDGKPTSAIFYNIASLRPEFSEFIEWILSLEAKDQDGKQIHPIVPGKESAWYP